jgi:hypothetical protein
VINHFIIIIKIYVIISVSLNGNFPVSQGITDLRSYRPQQTFWEISKIGRQAKETSLIALETLDLFLKITI